MAASTLATEERDTQLLVHRLLLDMGGVDASAISIADLAELASRAWVMGATFAKNAAIPGRRTCRICGCWEYAACEGGCAWAGPNICTSCDTEPL